MHLQVTSSSSFLTRAVRNFILSGLGVVSSFIIGLLFAGLTIRYLGEARAGYFLALNALTGFGILLADFGLATPAIQRITNLRITGDFVSIREIIGSIFTASFVSTILVVLPIAIFFPKVFAWSRLDPYFEQDAWWATLFTLGTLVLSQVSNSWRATYTAMERYDLISGLNTSWSLILGVGSILILTTLPTMTAISLFRFSVTLARLLTDGVIIKRLLQGVPWPCWTWRQIRPLLSFGIWVYAGTFGQLLLDRTISLILTTSLGSSVLPIYELPQRFYSQIHSLLNSQSQFLFPMFASYGENAAEQIVQRADRIRWLLAVSSGTAYTGLALLGHILLTHLVGPDFAYRAQLPLYLACIQGFLHAQDILPYYSTWALGRGRSNAIYVIAIGSCASLMTLFFVPILGVLGASLAQALAGITSLIYAIWVWKTITPNNSTFSFFSAFISPALMFTTWITIYEILTRATTGISAVPSSIFSSLAVIIGVCCGTAVLWGVETFLFPEKGRLTTLKKAVALPLRWVALRIGFSPI